MGSLATREAPGGSSRARQGRDEQKFVGWFLSVCALRQFGPVAGWRESNAAHTAGRPAPSRAESVHVRKDALRKPERVCSCPEHVCSCPKRRAPETGARLFLSERKRSGNQSASVHVRRDALRKPERVCSCPKRRAPESGARLFISEETRSGNRSVSVKPTRTPCLCASKARSGLRSAYFPNPRHVCA